MRKAIVVGGVVTNIVNVPGNWTGGPGEWAAPEGATLVDAGSAAPGDMWDGEVFARPATSITADQVKAEAYRRIVAICPEWRQRNLTAQATILAEKGRDNWTEAEAAAWDVGSAIWAQISAIRAKSDETEAMDPIPADYTADRYWSE